MFPLDSLFAPRPDGQRDSEDGEMEEIDRFECKDEHGNVYEVVLWERPVAHRPLSSSTRSGGGAREYTLADGSDVTPINIETQSFKVLKGDTIIRRI